MELIKNFFLAAVMVVTLSGAACAGEKVIVFAALPTQAQRFFHMHFSTKRVVKATVESDYFFQKEYQLLLSDGTKIDFDGAGRWTKVEMASAAVPVKITPLQILNYISQSFPTTFVTEIERTRNGYDVEISNGLDLEFNAKGRFLRVDD